LTSFTKPLIVKHLDGLRWELVEAFEYYTADKEHLIKVPKGFITDFASIPRIFWTVIGQPTGRYGKAAVIHDYLYFTQRFTRKYADFVFVEAMGILGVSWWKRRSMWLSVRIFGWIPWRKKDAYNSNT